MKSPISKLGIQKLFRFTSGEKSKSDFVSDESILLSTPDSCEFEPHNHENLKLKENLIRSHSIFSTPVHGPWDAVPLLSDVTVYVENSRYHLHIFPLLEYCAYFSIEADRFQLRADHSTPVEITLPKFPGGCSTFTTIASFCYAIKPRLNSKNVIEILCAADYLGMEARYLNKETNLVEICHEFLEKKVYSNIKHVLMILYQSIHLFSSLQCRNSISIVDEIKTKAEELLKEFAFNLERACTVSEAMDFLSFFSSLSSFPSPFIHHILVIFQNENFNIINPASILANNSLLSFLTTSTLALEQPYDSTLLEPATLSKPVSLPLTSNTSSFLPILRFLITSFLKTERNVHPLSGDCTDDDVGDSSDAYLVELLSTCQILHADEDKNLILGLEHELAKRMVFISSQTIRKCSMEAMDAVTVRCFQLLSFSEEEYERIAMKIEDYLLFKLKECENANELSIISSSFVKILENIPVRFRTHCTVQLLDAVERLFSKVKSTGGTNPQIENMFGQICNFVQAEKLTEERMKQMLNSDIVSFLPCHFFLFYLSLLEKRIEDQGSIIRSLKQKDMFLNQTIMQWKERRDEDKDMANGIKCTERWKNAHSSRVRALIHGGGGLLWSGSSDGMIKLWDESGKCIMSLIGHDDAVHCLAFGSEKTEPVFSGNTVSDKGIVSEPDSGLGSENMKPTGCGVADSTEDAVCVSSLGSVNSEPLWSGSADCTIKEWRFGICICTMKGHDATVNALVMGKDGMLWSGSNDCTIKAWKDGVCVMNIPTDSGIRCLLFSPDGMLWSGECNGMLRAWFRNECRYSALGKSYVCYALAMNNGNHDDDVDDDVDGRHVIWSGGMDGLVEEWCVDEKKMTCMHAHGGDVLGLVWHDGLLWSGGKDACVKAWAKGRCVGVLDTEGTEVWSIAVAKNGTLYCGGKDGCILSWKHLYAASKVE